MRLFLAALALCALVSGGCKRADPEKTLPVPASSDPDGKDLVEGAIVAAVEKSGGVRLYKITEVVYFPPPMSEELVMLAYHEKGNDFTEAARIWQKGGLTIAGAQVRVYRNMFRSRDYRVLTHQPVTDADKSAKPVEHWPERQAPSAK
jgi:hypothetical protein